MNDLERETHLQGNSARDWVGITALGVLLVIALFGFGAML